MRLCVERRSPRAIPQWTRAQERPPAGVAAPRSTWSHTANEGQATLNYNVRETIENWVGDFCQSDGLSDVVGETTAELRAHAPTALLRLLWTACQQAECEPAELEQEAVSAAFLNAVATHDLPPAVHAVAPQLCAAFLGWLEGEGRLGGGREMGAYLLAMKARYAEAAAGKQTPLRNAGSKLSRNDPCPCGSGKKYKKCCLNR